MEFVLCNKAFHSFSSSYEIQFLPSCRLSSTTQLTALHCILGLPSITGDLLDNMSYRLGKFCVPHQDSTCEPEGLN